MKKTILLFAIIFLTIFNSTAQCTKLLDFSASIHGSYPYGALISDGTFLYGITSGCDPWGIVTDSGTIFKIKPDGSNYSRLLDFTGTLNGSHPLASLISDGNFLYGMTSVGGVNNRGTIFKIKPDGSSFLKLFDFDSINGSNPYGSLFYDGTFLYGMTYYGCIYNYGTLFKIKPDGTNFSRILDFLGTTGSANGSHPLGTLISDSTSLYGMTSQGGLYDQGTIFKIKFDGTGYIKLLDLDGTTSGQEPKGSLVCDSTFLYGTTSRGGTTGKGTIFKIKFDGTGYTKLYDFASTTSSIYPRGTLIFNDNFLFGMTDVGGSSNMGTIYKIKTDGTSFTKVFDFAGSTTGSHPGTALISDSTYLYGITNIGGVNNKGTMFKICANPPNISINASATTVCSGISVILNAGGAVGYTWSGGITDGVAFVPTSTTTYTVTGTSIPGCSSTSIVHITVRPLPTAIITTSGTPTFCQNDSVILTANLTSSYFWSNGANTRSITVMNSGSYNVTTQNSFGCTKLSSPVTVNVYPLPNVNLSASEDTLCFNSGQLSLIGIPCGGQYSGTGIMDTVFIPSIAGAGTHEIIYSITDVNTCSNKDTLSIYVDLCLSSCYAYYSTNYDSTSNTFLLNVDTNTVSTATGFYWDFGDGATSSLDYPTHVYIQDSTYNVCLTKYSISGDSCAYCHMIGKDSLGIIIRNSGFNLMVVHPIATNTSITKSVNEIQIYPNPSKGIFILSANNTKQSTVEIYNSIGEIIFMSSENNLQFAIDLSKESSGIYYMRLMQENKIIKAEKLVITD